MENRGGGEEEEEEKTYPFCFIYPKHPNLMERTGEGEKTLPPPPLPFGRPEEEGGRGGTDATPVAAVLLC